MSLRQKIESVASQVVDSLVKVHKGLGPGLLESAYQACLVYELKKRNLEVKSEVLLPVYYDGQTIDAGYRLDLLVEDVVVVENKTVQTLLPVHDAQVLTYLRLSGCHLGFLVNWNVAQIKDGIKRLVFKLPET